MDLRDTVTDVGGKVMSNLHRVILKTSGGRFLRSALACLPWSCRRWDARAG